MRSASQSLQTLSPNAASEETPPPQTTPKLPKRERLNSISRLLKNKNLAGLSRKLTEGVQDDSPKALCTSKALLGPSVDIRVSPCSPTSKNIPKDVQDDIVSSCQGFLSPNRLPFSPRLLNRSSPANLSPSYRRPSPLRSPLYSPDRRGLFLGRGSFGKVTLCKYKGMNLAVKIVQSQGFTSMVGEQNLLGIRHPHLVEIFHVSSVLEGSLVFMEFAGHCNLQQVLDTKTKLDFRRRLGFCIQTASGLRHLHQNRIIHGDIKPANVMISPAGICKLGDFGNSSRIGSERLHATVNGRDIVGTAAYAAPEVLKGCRPGQPSDVYSFGIFLWQVQTREMPFAGEHPHVVIYKVVHYGTRPKFGENLIPAESRFAKVAEDCWRAVPSQRMDISRAMSSLQSLMDVMKEGNV